MTLDVYIYAIIEYEYLLFVSLYFNKIIFKVGEVQAKVTEAEQISVSTIERFSRFRLGTACLKVVSS